MAEPWHLVKDRPALRGVDWRSSNYALYGDMSRRVYQVLCGLVPASDLDIRSMRCSLISQA